MTGAVSQSIFWGTSWASSPGDKITGLDAWTFNVPYVKFSNGSEWKIQGEWSNSAYNNGTGYPNSSGQHG